MDKKQFAEECDRRRREGFVLTENTYDRRQAIKEAGGIWDARKKGWLMPTADIMRAFGSEPKPEVGAEDLERAERAAQAAQYAPPTEADLLDF